MLHRAVYLTTCQCFFFVSFAFISEFISIGFESPAGQSYSSAADLAKLMALMFSTDKPHDIKTGQVGVVQITQIIKIKGYRRCWLLSAYAYYIAYMRKRADGCMILVGLVSYPNPIIN